MSATLSDIIRRFKASKFGSRENVRKSFQLFPEKVIGLLIMFMIFSKLVMVVIITNSKYCNVIDNK